MARFLQIIMGENRDCIACLCGSIVACGLVATWVCWIVYGSIALDASVDYAKGCGWMLWGSTLAGLLYVPIGAALGLVAAGVGAIALCSSDEISTGSEFMDGCFSACILVCLNIINATFVGVLFYGLWDETCIPHSETIVVFAKVEFYMCIAVLSLSMFIAGLAAIKRNCCN